MFGRFPKEGFSFALVVSISEVSAPHSLMSVMLGGINPNMSTKRATCPTSYWLRPTWLEQEQQQHAAGGPESWRCRW